MKLNVPFLYTAIMQRSRSRAAKQFTFLGWETIEIKQLSAQDPCLSLVADIDFVDLETHIYDSANSKKPENYEKYIAENVQNILYYSFNNGLIKPFSLNANVNYSYLNSKYIKNKYSIKSLQTILNSWAEHLVLTKEQAREKNLYLNRDTNFLTQSSSYLKLPAIDERTIKLTDQTQSNRDQTVLALKSILTERSAVVDDIFYTLTAGPGYRPYTTWPTQYSSDKNKSYLILQLFQDRVQNNASFLPDQFEKAHKEAERIKNQYNQYENNKTIDQITVSGKINLINQQEFRRTTRLYDLLSAVESTIYSMSYELFYFEPQAIHLFADFKQLFEQTNQSKNEQNYDQLLELFRRNHQNRLRYYNDKMPDDKIAPINKFEKRLAKYGEQTMDEVVITLDDFEPLKANNVQTF